MLTTAVSAAGSVSDLRGTTAVSSNGTSRVSLSLQVELDQPPDSFVFPVPANARDITLNGSPARAKLSGNVRNVDLSSLLSFSHTLTFTIQYSLPDQITRDSAGRLWLELELLSGFAYPISSMELTVTLPGEVEYRPTFTSTYHMEDVESVLNVVREGSSIRCTLERSLNDREKLTMRLQVPESQFPQPIVKRWSLSMDDIIMYLLLMLALVYWVVFLRFWPGKAVPRSRAPEGITAGELGCCLTGSGGDLTMMVLSWAEKGYLRLQLDENGRVLLHKRMEMGNERSNYENKYFRTLFAKRKTVDTSGYFYAQVWEAVSRKAPQRSLYQKGSGNPYIFRGILTAAGIMGGYSLAGAFGGDTVWQVLLTILLCALAAVASWLIQRGPYVLLLRDKGALFIALGCSAVWIALGALASEVWVAAFTVFTQWLGGFAAAYGGRRSGPGRQAFRDILGLRLFMTTTGSKKLGKIQKHNPGFYYSLAPYACALGVDRGFAARMGKHRLPECPYLVSGMDGHLTASEWNRILRETVASMDAGHRRIRLERVLRKR